MSSPDTSPCVEREGMRYRPLMDLQCFEQAKAPVRSAHDPRQDQNVQQQRHHEYDIRNESADHCRILGTCAGEKGIWHLADKAKMILYVPLPKFNPWSINPGQSG